MDKLIPRNNTSFLKNAHETIKSIMKDKNDPLKYHQRIIHEYLLYYPHIRGLLAFWEMGAGKTILAASICDGIIKQNKYRKVLFISSKTLHGNFMGDYKKYLRMINSPISGSDVEMEKYIENNCDFITLTANNMLRQVYKTTQMKGDEDIMESFEKLIVSDDKRSREEIKKLNVLGNLDNIFIIIDEAHNFFNGITNGSKNYVGLYQLIMNAKNIKMLFLSGSPITNDPFEIGLCFNMLNGYYSTKKEKLTLFGEEYDDFRKYFITHPYADLVEYEDESEEKKYIIPVIKNKDKFSNRIIGLVSYYGTDQADIQKLFPKLEELIIQRIPMSIKQYAAYASARDKEQEETKRGLYKSAKKTLQKPQGASSSYRVRSRQISNFLYPNYASSTFKDEKGFVKYEKYIDKLKPECFEVVDDKTLTKLSKDDSETEYGLETWSPKMVQLMVNCSIHLPKGMLDQFRKLANTDKWKPVLLKVPEKSKNIESKKSEKIGVGPGMIYSQFKNSGVELIGSCLKHYGMKEIKDIKDIGSENEKGTFVIISGDVTPELRTELIKLAISPDNKKGKLLSLLMITATGAEGISTKYMRHIHAFEPFWHDSRIAQVFARAARLGSHIDLEETERTVQPYIYLSDYPLVFEDKEQTKIKTVEDTTDVTLYYKAMQNQILIDSFLKTMKESSLDCAIHYENDKDVICKMCAPTDVPLFIQDLDQDMKSPSPCQPIKEEKIKAQSITVEDAKGKREYMYYIDDKSDIHIFNFNNQINAYQEIFEDNLDYFDLFNKITKLQKKEKK